MFCKRDPSTEITVIRGNTATVKPEGLTFGGAVKNTVLLGETVMLIVKSKNGKIYLSRTISGKENEEIPILFELKPSDTIDLYPFRYDYSIDLYTGNGTGQDDDFYTLRRGTFNLVPCVGCVKDVGENEP